MGNLYEWGANAVRLFLSSDLYLQNCPGVSYPISASAYVADLQKEVNLITSYGMVAILTLASTNPNCQFQPTSWGLYGVPAPLPPAADATAFFTSLASKLGSNPLVSFELYNEPHVCGSGSPQTDSSSYPNGCSSQAAWPSSARPIPSRSAALP